MIESASSAWHSGADLFLAKPILPSELARAIQQVVARTPAECDAAYQALVNAQQTLEHPLDDA